VTGIAAGFAPSVGGGGNLLFSQGNAAPSIMNKTHPLGTSRGGIIKSVTDKQDQDFSSKTPKYWSTSRVGGEQRNRAVTTDAVDGPTGQPNRPVMVVHVELSTDYRLTDAEAVAVGRNASAVATDDGKRIEVIGGFDFEPFTKAMEDARMRGIVLTDYPSLIGKRLTITRAGQKPNPGRESSWIKAYRIDNA
jgi:hypothetical protein